MSTPDRDEEFEAFLARRSLLPRALAEHEDAQPPLEVDRSVLEKARAAVQATPARKSFRSWPVPVALAATVLISLAIVVQVQRPASDTLTASQPVMPREALEPTLAPLQKRAAPEEPEPDIGALSDSPERFARASAPAESRALIANEARREAKQRADEFAADTSAGATAQSRREMVAASPPPSADEDASTDLAASAPPSPAPAPALADARARSAAEADRGVASDSAATAAARSGTDSVSAVEAENGRAAAPAAAASAERDPKAWLERIAKLRAEGKHAQADREFKAFAKRYPDYVTDEAAR